MIGAVLADAAGVAVCQGEAFGEGLKESALIDKDAIVGNDRVVCSVSLDTLLHRS